MFVDTHAERQPLSARVYTCPKDLAERGVDLAARVSLACVGVWRPPRVSRGGGGLSTKNYEYALAALHGRQLSRKRQSARPPRRPPPPRVSHRSPQTRRAEHRRHTEAHVQPRRGRRGGERVVESQQQRRQTKRRWQAPNPTTCSPLRILRLVFLRKHRRCRSKNRSSGSTSTSSRRRAPA